MNNLILYLGFAATGFTCILSAVLFFRLRIPAVLSYMFKFKKGDRYYLKKQKRIKKEELHKTNKKNLDTTDNNKTEIITSVQNYAYELLNADSTVVLDDLQMTELMRDDI